jgi:TonB-linked SusC/RagA family outer membrane protein
MTSTRSIRWSARLLAGLFVATGASTAAAQQRAISGTITEAGANAPIAQVQIQVVGTNLGALTNAEGRYTIRGVNPGTYQLRALRVGFTQQTRSVTVGAAEDATADFVLQSAPISLAPVVTTATGEQRKVELGNNVTVMDAATRVETAPVKSVGEILTATAPGVQLLTGNITGAGERIRVRGTNSLSLNNEPIVVIDGVRMVSDNNSASIGVGGTNPSRLADINPEEIETIEVVKGPSAATLYGTDAANGVIVITTKRGRAGAPRWSVYGETGIITDRNEYPAAYRGWRTGPTSGTTSTPTNSVQCHLPEVAAGTCTQDSVSAFNLWDDADASPLGTGDRQQLGAQVSGGSEVARYFLAGEWEDEVGLLEMPGFAVEKVRDARSGAGPLEEQLRPNALRRVSARANVSANLTRTFDATANTNFITSIGRRPQIDNNTTGLQSNAYGGPGNKDNGLMGYRAFTPDEMFSETVTQGINRFIGSGSGNWRPATWFTGRFTGGIDFVSRNESDICRRDQCTSFGTTKDGFKTNNRSEFFQYTADASGAATFRLTPTIESRTTGGVQWVHDRFERNGASTEGLPPGGTQAGQGSTPDAEEVYDRSKTLGAFVEQQFSWRDRLFVAGAVRADDNSAFGKDFTAVYYPKASLSWVMSDESFFPRTDWFSSFRLRAAYGASGTQPGPNDALRFYDAATTADESGDIPAIVFDALGNADLKPERATEAEAGFDAAFLNSRVNFEFTYYRKRTKDALVERTIAPSAGTAEDRFENIGAVENKGVEYLLNSRLLDRPALGIDFTISGSYNTNKVVDLGGAAPEIGATRQQREGFPIDGYWQRKYTYNDANNDGLIALSELAVDDTATFVGSDKPDTEIAFTAGLDLFNKKLRIQGLVDHKGGYYLLNGSDRIRCESRRNCYELNDPSAPLWRQARATAVRYHDSHTQFGFMEDAAFTRFREISATLQLPDRWASAARVNRVSMTLAGRNLFTWTDYTGIDPESNYFAGARGTVSDFQTTPPPSSFTFRVNVGF